MANKPIRQRHARARAGVAEVLVTDLEAAAVVDAIIPGVRVSTRHGGGWWLIRDGLTARVAGDGSPEAQARALADGAHGIRLAALARAQEGAEREWRASIERRVEALEGKIP